MDEENYSDQTKYPDYRLEAIKKAGQGESPQAIRASKELHRRQKERNDKNQQTQIDIKKISFIALLVAILGLVIFITTQIFK